MKKILAVLLSFVLFVSVMAGCSNKSPSNASAFEHSNISEIPSPKPEFVYSNYEATQDMINRSIINEGNSDRIISAMQRAKAGNPVTIGFIGGSITYGASALANNSYADLVTRWWKKKFPNAKVKLVNAGISGTGSIIGVHRAQKDLLVKKPDFVIMDFAVNDTGEEIVNEAYENLTRDILNSEKKPGLLLLFMCNDKGDNFQEPESLTGKHYNLPMASYKDAIWPEIQNNKLKWNEISPDFIHPNDKGHHITADLIIYRLEEWYKQIDKEVHPDTSLPAPITEARFKNASYLTNQTLTVLEYGGFQATNTAHWQLKEGWKAVDRNKPMKFEVTAKNISLVYNKTIDNKGASVKVVVDGKKEFKLESKSPFAWEAITADQIVLSDKVEKHTISIELSDDIPKGCTGENFNLLGVLISE